MDRNSDSATSGEDGARPLATAISPGVFGADTEAERWTYRLPGSGRGRAAGR